MSDFLNSRGLEAIIKSRLGRVFNDATDGRGCLTVSLILTLMSAALRNLGVILILCFSAEEKNQKACC